MNPSSYYIRFNLNRAELIIGGIFILTTLYVIGIFIYSHSNPSQTITFKILSKEFIQESNDFSNSYGGPSRYRVIRSILIPAHYLVKVHWGDDDYTLTVPKDKGPLIQGDKITFTYRVLKNGRLHILKFHDTHALTDDAEIVQFGIFEFQPGIDGFEWEIRLTSQTDRIPAKLGVTFGYKFEVTGTPQNAYTELLCESVYPRLMAPDKNELIHDYHYSTLVEIGPNNFALYQFEENWELAPGKWTLSIKDGDQVLVQKSFTVYKP